MESLSTSSATAIDIRQANTILSKEVPDLDLVTYLLHIYTEYNDYSVDYAELLQLLRISQIEGFNINYETLSELGLVNDEYPNSTPRGLIEIYNMLSATDYIIEPSIGQSRTSERILFTAEPVMRCLVDDRESSYTYACTSLLHYAIAYYSDYAKKVAARKARTNGTLLAMLRQSIVSGTVGIELHTHVLQEEREIERRTELMCLDIDDRLAKIRKLLSDHRRASRAGLEHQRQLC